MSQLSKAPGNVPENVHSPLLMRSDCSCQILCDIVVKKVRSSFLETFYCSELVNKIDKTCSYKC